MNVQLFQHYLLKSYPFSFEFPLPFCPRSIAYISFGLSLGSLFCFINLFHYSYTVKTLLWLLYLYSKSSSWIACLFIFTLFCFTILYWFCHTLTWIHHGCSWVPNPEPPSHLPAHIISLDHPHAPAPCILYPVSNLYWRFISYMIVYMFQCHSPKSSHPLPLPQSPKVHSVHLCLFCCLRVIITIFLNYIYMC